MTASVSTPWIGCIADDFTGASDLASFLVASGMRTIQVNGVPSADQLRSYSGFDALVIALKSRTAPVADAIDESLKSLAALQARGCRKFYFKYCSTFDSTAQGNIGPVIDALLAALGESSTVLCPALPINGRTVYQGHLFVFNQLLHESPMKDHPLTPMRDSSLVRLIEAQGSGKAISIAHAELEAGEERLAAVLTQAAEKYRYLVVDAVSEANLRTLGHVLSNFKLVTGGSGLALDLCHEFEALGFERKPSGAALSGLQAPALILSGSCSAMTQRQVAHYRDQAPSVQLDPLLVANGEQSVELISAWLREHRDAAPLVYATASAEDVAKAHTILGKSQTQCLVEDTFAALAQAALGMGFRNIVAAGGETSGAVVKALDVRAFEIGRSIAPGVPMVRTIGGEPLNLALKSGNFGRERFFSDAVEALTCT